MIRKITVTVALVALLFSLCGVPAFAATSDTALISGVWVFNPTHDQYYDDYVGGCSVEFTSGDVSFNHIEVTSSGGLVYGLTSEGKVCTCSDGTPCGLLQEYHIFSIDRGLLVLRNARAGTDISDEFLTIDFGDTPVAIPTGLYNWIRMNANPNVAATRGDFTVYVDGEQYRFPAYSSYSFPVKLRVTDDGCELFTERSGAKKHLSSTGKIVGLSETSGSTSATYTPGNTYDLGVISSFSTVSLYTVQYTLSGEWIGKSSLSAWPESLSNQTISLSFSSNGVSYSSMKSMMYLSTGGQSLYYGDTRAYSFGVLEQDVGWVQSYLSKVYFDTPQVVPKAFYDWFTSNYRYAGTEETRNVFSATVNIYDFPGTTLLQSFSASSTGVSPAVSANLSDSGAIFLFDQTQFSWSASDFKGFSLIANSGDVDYPIGDTYDLMPGVASDVTINLYLFDDSEKQYRAGVLGWFERLWDAIAALPSKIASALVPAWISNIFSGNTDIASGVTSVFSTVWKSVTSLFGFTDLFDDPSGPFDWLKG